MSFPLRRSVTLIMILVFVVTMLPVALVVPPASGATLPTLASPLTLSATLSVQPGTAMAWGLNTAGQLGDGTTTTRTTPVPVAGLSGVTAIAAGYNHRLALLGDGPCVPGATT